METLYCYSSGGTENPYQDDADSLKYYHHEHMFSTATESLNTRTLMDPSLGKFDVPAASVPITPLEFMSVLIPIWVPLCSCNEDDYWPPITHLQSTRACLLSYLSMAIAGAMEVKRKNEFNHHHHRTSLFWLSFHYAIFGIANMFTACWAVGVLLQ